MKVKLKAAVGSLLVGGVLAGAAVMPASSSAHGNTGPLCYGNDPFGVPMTGAAGGGGWQGHMLAYNEAFRIKETVVFAGQFWSLGHSASSYPTDYWVLTPDLRCY